MATRLYLPSSGTPPATFDVTVPLDFFADPYELFASYEQLPMYTTKQSTSFVTKTKTDTSVNAELWYCAQWISPPMTSTHLWSTGTNFAYSIRMSENNNSANFNGAMALCIVSPGSGTGFGGSDYQVFNTFSGGEPTTSLRSVFDNLNTPSGSYTNVSGDRIVVLAGAFKNSTNSFTLNIEIGDNAANDLDASDADTGQDNPWIEFDYNITFGSEGGGGTPTTNNQLMMTGIGT